jgi:hypothetical protein
VPFERMLFIDGVNPYHLHALEDGIEHKLTRKHFRHCAHGVALRIVDNEQLSNTSSDRLRYA